MYKVVITETVKQKNKKTVQCKSHSAEQDLAIDDSVF